MRLQSILLVVLVGAAFLTGVATARTAAVPQNTSNTDDRRHRTGRQHADRP
jgi:hypothetical protein